MKSVDFRLAISFFASLEQLEMIQEPIMKQKQLRKQLYQTKKIPDKPGFKKYVFG
jgi:hypothetical protein